MAKNKRNTFRKNPIDEISDMKKTQSIQSKSGEALESINSKLDDIQASGELGSEVMQSGFDKLNQVIDNKVSETNATLDDLVAGSELISETVNIHGRNLTKISTTMSNQLSNIYKVLSSGALNNKPEKPPEAAGGSSDGGIEPPAPQEGSEYPVPEPAKPTPEPTNGSSPPNNNNSSNDGKKPKRTRHDIHHFYHRSGNSSAAIKEGFKGLQKSSDKISGFLFDITVTSALNVAKTALMIGAIILVADVIRMKFQYFGKLLETNFKTFNEKLGKFAPLMEHLLTGIDSVTKLLEGNFTAEQLASTLGRAVGSVLKDAISAMALGLSKAIAGLLRHLPFNWAKGAADNVEGQGLYEYQSNTNATLSGNDLKLAAMSKESHDEEKRKDYNIDHNFNTDGTRNANSDPNAQPMLPPDYEKFSDDKKYETIGKMMNLMAQSRQDKERMESAYDPKGDNSGLIKSMQSSVSSINNEYNELQKISPDAANNVKSTVDSMNSTFKGLSHKGGINTQADSPKNSQTSIQERNINTLASQAKQLSSDVNSATNGNIGVTNIKNVNHRNVYQMEPRTSSPAPGMRETYRVP